MEDSKPKEELKSLRQIRIRYLDLKENVSDPFMRYWIILSNLGPIRMGIECEDHLAKIFVETGANCNTTTLKLYRILLNHGLKYGLCPRPYIYRGIDKNLMGGQTINMTGDNVTTMTEVLTILRTIYSEQEFLESDVNDIVLSVRWFDSIMNAKRG